MQTDAALVEAYRNGDTGAFEELYRRYLRPIYSFVYVRTHHRQTAEDIVSQTFLQALEHISSFDAKRGSFAGWIYRIARNLTIDTYRKAKPTQDIEDAWDLPDGTDIPTDADTALRVRDVRVHLKGLTAKQRDTVLLRAWDGRSFQEIAEILGTTEAASKMAYKRALEALRSALLLLLLSLISFPHE